MRSIRDILADANATRAHNLTSNQKELVENFYTVLAEWDAGNLTLAQAETASGTPYQRFMMMMSTSPNSPEWALMQRFFDAVILRDRGAGVVTSSGWISEERIKSHQGRIVDVVDPDGVVRQAAVFPTEYGVGLDGKPDPFLPIYGNEPDKWNADNFPVESTNPDGYMEWHDEDVT